MKMIFRELYLFSPHDQTAKKLNLKKESILLHPIKRMEQIEENP
jgi:hypothetical protein